MVWGISNFMINETNNCYYNGSLGKLEKPSVLGTDVWEFESPTSYHFNLNGMVMMKKIWNKIQEIIFNIKDFIYSMCWLLFK